MQFLLLLLCFIWIINPIQSQVISPVFFDKQNFDVLSYDIYLDLSDIPKLSAKGICTTQVKFNYKNDFPEYKFHLRGLIIDSIKYNGSIAEFEAIGKTSDSNFHYITYPRKPYQSYLLKDTSEIIIFYSGNLTNEGGATAWGGVFNIGSMVFHNGVGFNNNYVSCGQHWFPCFDLPYDKAKFKMTFKVKSDYKVASNGLFSLKKIDNQFNEYSYTHSFPMATYLASFAVDKFVFDSLKNDYNNIPIHYFCNQNQYQRFSKLIPAALEALKIFETKIGLYPYEKIGYVVTPKGSMEHQTIINIDQNVLNYSDWKAKSVLVHEFAHQWFGDCVSPKDFRDAWLSESFATYLESIYMENVNLPYNYIQKLGLDLSTYLDITKSEGFLPLYDFPRQIVSNYPGTIYYKGSVLLGMLRYDVGDSLFFNFLKHYLQKFKYSSASTKEFKNELEKYSNRNFNNFFEQWIYKGGYPDLALNCQILEINNGIAKLNINIRQTQIEKFGLFEDFPLELKFDSGNLYNKVVRIDSENQNFIIDSIPYPFNFSANNGYNVKTLCTISKILITDNKDKENLAIQISPNPASNYINIKPNDENNIRQIDLYNSFGEKILSSSYNYENEVNLNISSLPQGVYFIKLGSKIEKLIKI